MTRVNKSGIFTPLNENANDLVRGYFMRDSEGGYAPNNYQVNTRGGGNNLMNNYLKFQKAIQNKSKKIRGIEALHSPSIMIKKEKKSTKKKTTKKK
tara:strand:+ start:108 stop:395 length:288 start_codon:yes stop_codon:yes gene_type:complete